MATLSPKPQLPLGREPLTLPTLKARAQGMVGWTTGSACGDWNSRPVGGAPAWGLWWKGVVWADTFCGGNSFPVASNLPLLPHSLAHVNHHRLQPRIPASPWPFAGNEGNLSGLKSHFLPPHGVEDHKMRLKRASESKPKQEGREGGRGSTSSLEAVHQEAPNTLGKLPSGLAKPGLVPFPKL